MGDPKYYLLFTPSCGLLLFTHQAEDIGLYQLRTYVVVTRTRKTL